jgi:multidrug efflux system membrane fusion protein
VKTLRWMWVAALMAVLTMSGGCGEEAEERAPVVRPVKSIVVGDVLSGSRSFPGKVEASERVDLSFRVSGRLIELPVERGQEVSRGQLLARIDPRDYRIALDEAKAAFTKAEADYVRYQNLYEKDAVSISELDFHRAQRDVARARLDDAEANLDYTYLTAPFAGVIGTRYVEKFEEVRVNQIICSVHDINSLDIIVDVPEHLIANVRNLEDAGLDVIARFEAAPGEEFRLRFREVAAQADPATRTYELRLTMSQPQSITVLPGMTAEVVARGTRAAAESSVFTVPAGAVFPDEEGKAQAVWVIDPEALTLHKRKVEIGEVTGTGSVEVLSGLRAGERIAVAGVSRMREGMKVRLMEE